MSHLRIPAVSFPALHPRALPATLVLLALLAAGCSKEAQHTDDVRPVRASVLVPTPVSADAELPGEVRPRVESRVGFQVAGRINGDASNSGSA